MVFSFHGNTPRNPDLKLPVFTGLNPTLYLDPDLKLAWYAGSSGWDLQSLLKCVLRKIATVARSNDLIFLGGSGGGFASLYCAASFPGSLALVWNPQTDIGAYSPPHVPNTAGSLSASPITRARVGASYADPVQSGSRAWRLAGPRHRLPAEQHGRPLHHSHASTGPLCCAQMSSATSSTTPSRRPDCLRLLEGQQI